MSYRDLSGGTVLALLAAAAIGNRRSLPFRRVEKEAESPGLTDFDIRQLRLAGIKRRYKCEKNLRAVISGGMKSCAPTRICGNEIND